ncbi:type IV pilus biogenesis protein PilM, partial [Pseudomonas sp. GP01-A4]|uniref:type IV pilus biogenesis protein PilM n=1 Tax=Pseudomonas sp. GP01-A4 TaxID=2070571 RepID=UPI000CA72873
LKEHGIHATSAHIAAAGGSVFIRPIIFPKMSESTLRKSIRFEAGRYVPGSVDDSFIEFDILGPVDETRMNVLIVAAPKDIVQSR